MVVKEFISQLPPDKLSPFKSTPIRCAEDAAMDELGGEHPCPRMFCRPLLARPKGECYELVSGHRRRLAAQKLACHRAVLVREMTDDEAVIWRTATFSGKTCCPAKRRLLTR